MAVEVPVDREERRAPAEETNWCARTTWFNLIVGTAGRTELGSLGTDGAVECASFELPAHAGCGLGAAEPSR
ncbi:MAG: hypothetical protein ACYDEA_05130 [Candidatus Dormibacteria bacterium]